MEQKTNTSEAPPRPPASSELVRPREGRMIAGVAEGLSRRFGITSWITRAIFIVLAIAGGLGLVLYAAGWALIRADDEAQSPAERFFANATGPRSWFGIGLIFVAALILLDNFTYLSGGVVWAGALLVVGVLLYMGHIPLSNDDRDRSKEGVQQMTTTQTPAIEKTAPDAGVSPAGAGTVPPPPVSPTPTPPLLPPAASVPKERSILGRLTVGLAILGMGILAILDNIPGIPIDADPRHYLALGVTILGLGLLVGAVWGRARWLILVGVVLLPTLLFSPVFEWTWNDTTFELREAPSSFQEVEPLYSLDLGNAVIDLTALPWDGQTIDLDVSMGGGNLTIIIPDGVGIVGEATVDAGRVSADGRESSGIGSPTLTFNEPGPLGTVTLHASVDLGNIDISR